MASFYVLAKILCAADYSPPFNAELYLYSAICLHGIVLN
jgi:hypothetical protein